MLRLDPTHHDFVAETKCRDLARDWGKALDVQANTLRESLSNHRGVWCRAESRADVLRRLIGITETERQARLRIVEYA
jgi:hypothetical protein